MSTSTQAHAALAVDAYKTYPPDDWEKGVELDGLEYRILDQVSTGSGYQGTLYQRKDTGEMIVAHRGTEFDRELVRDGLLADGGMVVLGVNGQGQDAIEFTRRAIERANFINGDRSEIHSLTVTGHSLGGTLAQITAHRFGLKGETFNAYGAAGLASDLPAGGDQVINHVRATDFVSAASKHVGEVRVYAHQQDIDALRDKGYANDNRFFTDLRNPLGVAFGVGVAAHYGRNFLPGNDVLGAPMINDDNRTRYEQHQPMVDKYRHDVALIHGALALPRNAVDAVVDRARELVRGQRAQTAQEHAPAGDGRVPASAPDPTHPQHPDHALFQQIRTGVHALDASLGRTPDTASERLAASLLAQAKAGGLDRVDHVLLSARTPDAAEGSKVFAVQGAPGDPAHLRVHVDTQQALDTPLAASFKRAAAISALQAEQAALVQPTQQEVPLPMTSRHF